MFEQILVKTVKRLAAAKAKKLLDDFALVGGFAVSRWGAPRATADIDFFIALENAEIVKLANHLGGELRIGDLNDPLVATISFEERDTLGAIPIQLLQFPPAWEVLAREKIQIDKLDGTPIPVVGWSALVLLKLYAGSNRDLEDARNVLQVVLPSKGDIKALEKRASALRVSKRLSRVLGA